ncbi:hypothetical protein [Aeromicrobium sp.]|uniref:hypothetical protein n=1 Tax=Aeromicrobium sp. TaxID=1871063 RepID=UPI002FC89889
MAVFRWIEFWPSGGREDRPWTDDPATDALVKSACRVSQAYSDALRDEHFEGPCSSLRFSSHPHDDDAVQLQVSTARHADWEHGIVFVPEVVAELSADDRARLVLDLIHEAVVELAPHRGWSLEQVERVRARVLAQDLEFPWASPWKASSDRSMTARVVFRVADDGLGRAMIEVRERTSGDLVARSAPALAYNALTNFRASARTLRWVNGIVQFIPRPGSPHGEVSVSLDPALPEIHSEPPVGHADVTTAVVTSPEIVRAPYGSHVKDRTPAIKVFSGFGVGLRVGCIPDIDGTDFGEKIELEIFDRLGSGEGGISEWVDGLPIEIVLEYHLPGQVDGFGAYGIRLRRTAKRLNVVVLRDASWCAGGEVAESLVRHEMALVVELVMAALHARAAKRAKMR